MNERQRRLHRMAQKIAAIRTLARTLDEQMQGDPYVIAELRASASELNGMIREEIEREAEVVRPSTT